jgi:hypothetical protein
MATVWARESQLPEPGFLPPISVFRGPFCEGIPLKPLSISVIKEVNLACNTLLPAEPEH